MSAARCEILLFGVLAEIVGARRLELPLTGPTPTVGDVLDRVLADHPELGPHRATIALAVNERYADRADPVPEGARIALIPPVSGG